MLRWLLYFLLLWCPAMPDAQGMYALHLLLQSAVDLRVKGLLCEIQSCFPYWVLVRRTAIRMPHECKFNGMCWLYHAMPVQ